MATELSKRNVCLKNRLTYRCQRKENGSKWTAERSRTIQTRPNISTKSRPIYPPVTVHAANNNPNDLAYGRHQATIEESTSTGSRNRERQERNEQIVFLGGVPWRKLPSTEVCTTNTGGSPSLRAPMYRRRKLAEIIVRRNQAKRMP